MGAMNPSGLSLCHLYRPGGFKVTECDFIKVQDGEACVCLPKHFLIKGIDPPGDKNEKLSQRTEFGLKKGK